MRNGTRVKLGDAASSNSAILAAAGIARDPVGAERPVTRDETRLHQRAHQRYEACGIAARIGDAPGGGYRFALAHCHFRKPIDPSRRDPVRGRGVDHLDLGIVDQRYRGARGVIWQTKDHRIGAVEQPFPLFDVLALFGSDGDKRDVTPALQPLANLQARCSGFAINEDSCDHDPLQNQAGASRKKRPPD